MELKGKTILVSGASSGIGQAIAIRLARAGAVIIINYRKNKAGAEDTLKKVAEFSKGYIFQAELGDLKATQAMFEQIKDQVGSIDLLVNNAGDSRSGKANDYDLWAYQTQNILMSAVQCSNEYVSQLAETAMGKIVNITSVYGTFNGANTSFIQYSAMKAALNSFTISSAKLYGPHILVNAVAPGFTWTPPWEGTTEADLAQNRAGILTKRFVEPDEIAQMVEAVLENDSLTGQIITVDGGLNLAKY